MSAGQRRRQSPQPERVSVFHAGAIFAKPPADGVPLQYPTRMTGSISLLSPLRFVVAEPSRRAAKRSHNLTGATLVSFFIIQNGPLLCSIFRRSAMTDIVEFEILDVRC
jgi:hypothetical protein